MQMAQAPVCMQDGYHFSDNLLIYYVTTLA